MGGIEITTIRDIIYDWLRANGFDGLYTDNCGCKLSDLMPCDCVGDCKPGYKVNAEADDPEGFDFYIKAERPKPPATPPPSDHKGAGGSFG